MKIENWVHDGHQLPSQQMHQGQGTQGEPTHSE
jgi:hypothetical protein